MFTKCNRDGSIFAGDLFYYRNSQLCERFAVHGTWITIEIQLTISARRLSKVLVHLQFKQSAIEHWDSQVFDQNWKLAQRSACEGEGLKPEKCVSEIYYLSVKPKLIQFGLFSRECHLNAHAQCSPATFTFIPWLIDFFAHIKFAFWIYVSSQYHLLNQMHSALALYQTVILLDAHVSIFYFCERIVALWKGCKFEIAHV